MAESLGQLIAEARRRREMTLRTLAATVDVSPALLSLIEQDKHVPQAELVCKLAAVFGSNPDAWCAMIGRLDPGVESQLVDIARNDPKAFHLFRTRLSNGSGGLNE